MIITVTAPEAHMVDYLDVVREQVDEGYSSGYIGVDAHWEISDDAADDPEVLGRIFSGGAS